MKYRISILLRIQLILFPISFFVIVACCKRDNDDDKPTPPINTSINIVLYNKPLDTIQHYIQGKWKLVYGKGGICGTCINYCNNCFIEFTSNNKFISNTYAITTDTTSIRWERGIATYTHNDSTYLMTFKDIQGVPAVYVIERIYYDTLIYHDNSSDAIFYHFIKSN